MSGIPRDLQRLGPTGGNIKKPNSSEPTDPRGGRSSIQPFSVNPAARIKDVERTLREQEQLKEKDSTQTTSGTLSDALFAVHGVLLSAEIPHALFGGLASNLYREEVRATVNVDVAVAVAPARVVDLVPKLEAQGWKVDASRRQGKQLRLTRNYLPSVDCILAITDYERRAIAQAVPARIAGQELKVLTPEDLIVFKLIAGRARDYEAVAAIINARVERLEVDFITGWLEQFDVVERWERAWKEARREAD